MHPTAHRILVRLLPTTLAAWCLLPTVLSGQGPEALRTGDYVRVTTTDQPALLAGTVTSVDADRLQIRSAGRDSTVLYAQIQGLERRLCRWCRIGTASIVGAGAGLVILGGAGAAVARDQCDTGDCQEWQAFTYWGIAGASAGALLGLLVGGPASAERWASVPLPGTSNRLGLAEFGVRPDNTIRLHISVFR